MTEVPAETPPTTPDAEPMVATAVLLLVQWPPEVASLNVAVDPIQEFTEPVIPTGLGYTVTLMTLVCKHPPASVVVTE